MRASTFTRVALLLAAALPGHAQETPPPAPPAALPPLIQTVPPAQLQPVPVTPTAPAEPSTGVLEMRLETRPAPPPAPAPAPAPLVAKLPPPTPESARVLELEASLARTTQLYLVLDSSRRLIEVKARGVVLDQVPLRELALLHYRPLLGGDAGAEPALPAVWKVAEGPGDFSRETIAPESLRPYVSEEEREEPEAQDAKKPEPLVPTPPTSYSVRMDSEWDLAIVDRSPHPSFLARYAQAVREGWARLRGHAEERRPLVALSLDPDDARRLHHVFRTELPVLVVVPEPEAG